MKKRIIFITGTTVVILILVLVIVIFQKRTIQIDHVYLEGNDSTSFSLEYVIQPLRSRLLHRTDLDISVFDSEGRKVESFAKKNHSIPIFFLERGDDKGYWYASFYGLFEGASMPEVVTFCCDNSFREVYYSTGHGTYYTEQFLWKDE